MYLSCSDPCCYTSIHMCLWLMLYMPVSCKYVWNRLCRTHGEPATAALLAPKSPCALFQCVLCFQSRSSLYCIKMSKELPFNLVNCVCVYIQCMNMCVCARRGQTRMLYIQLSLSALIHLRQSLPLSLELG